MNIEEINKFDRSGMLQLILDFPEQMENALALAKKADIRIRDKSIKNICVLGMGGSAIGGDIIRSYLFNALKIPFYVNRFYKIPAFVDEHSLVFACSYSGNTEETLSAYQQAIQQNATIVGITAGGQLAETVKHRGQGIISIPGGQPPRSALGYLSIPLLYCLAANGFIPEQESVITETVSVLRELRNTLKPDATENEAEQLSRKLYRKIPLILSSTPYLDAVTLRWKGQFSENSEIMAFANVFPELNHNEIMGWGPYGDVNGNFKVVYLDDIKEHERVRRRMEVSEEMFLRQTDEVLRVRSRGETLLARIFSLIFIGDMVSFYLAIRNKVDPTAIKNIDFLKHSLTNP